MRAVGFVVQQLMTGSRAGEGTKTTSVAQASDDNTEPRWAGFALPTPTRGD
jgi:hypothetical protein